MLSKIKKVIAGLAIAVVGSVLPVASIITLAQPVMAVTCPQGSVRGSADTLAECNVQEDNSLIPTVQQIINVVLGLLGLVAVAMIIMGGVQYMTSSGDTTKVTKAKNTILYGIVGLVIALLAFAIVNFVLEGVFSNKTASTASVIIGQKLD